MHNSRTALNALWAALAADLVPRLAHSHSHTHAAAAATAHTGATGLGAGTAEGITHRFDAMKEQTALRHPQDNPLFDLLVQMGALVRFAVRCLGGCAREGGIEGGEEIGRAHV